MSLVLFIWQELRTKEPIVDLHVFNDRTFTVGTIFTTVVMFALYGTMVLTPLYCQLLAGYTPLLAGKVVGFQYVGTFASILLAGRLFNRFDPRLLVFIGCWSAGYGAWNMTDFNPQTDYWGIAWPGFFRGIGSGFIFMPLSTLSLASVPNVQMGTASGLFNMVRTIGGGIGIAAITIFAPRAQIHQSYWALMCTFNPVCGRRVAAVGERCPDVQ